MYLLYCSIAFLILSIYKPHRYEWFTLSIVTFLVAMFLIRRKTTLGFYHALILLCTLLMYGYLAYYVVLGTHNTIRNFYKATIYGLVGCQFISIFPTLWSAYRSYRSSNSPVLVNLQRNSRS